MGQTKIRSTSFLLLLIFLLCSVVSFSLPAVSLGLRKVYTARLLLTCSFFAHLCDNTTNIGQSLKLLFAIKPVSEYSRFSRKYFGSLLEKAEIFSKARDYRHFCTYQCQPIQVLRGKTKLKK